MSEPTRRWDAPLQRWITDSEVSDALDAAQLAIDEYYNGDRDWAVRWLVTAREANQQAKSE